MEPRLQHDVAWALTKQIVEVFAPCLREEEQKEAFSVVYEHVREALSSYELQVDRMQRRLKPNNN